MPIIFGIIIALFIGTTGAIAIHNANNPVATPTPFELPAISPTSYPTSTYIPTPTPDNSEFIRVRAIALSNCVGSAGAGYVHNIQVAQQNQQDTPENLTMMYNLEQSEINDCYRVTGVTRTNF